MRANINPETDLAHHLNQEGVGNACSFVSSTMLFMTLKCNKDTLKNKTLTCFVLFAMSAGLFEVGPPTGCLLNESLISCGLSKSLNSSLGKFS